MAVEPAQTRGRVVRGGEQAFQRGRAIVRAYHERHLERGGRAERQPRERRRDDGPRGLAHDRHRPAVDDGRLGEVELGAALEHARLDARRSAEGEHRVVVARVGLARVKQQRDVVELRERHRRATGERVVAAQQHALALVADHVGLEPVARGRAAHEPGVERPFAHGVEDVRGGHDAGADLELRDLVRHRLEQPGRRLVARAGAVAEDDAAALARGEALHGAPQIVGRVEQAGSALEQEPPGVGQRDLVRRAPQQLDAELALEQAHLPAQRRLGDVQALGRAREVALGRHGDEVAQPAQLGHGPDASRRIRP